MSQVKVVKWQSTDTTGINEEEAQARLHQEGYENFKWTDVAGADYPRHRHDYDECLWILEGEISFTIEGVVYQLQPGDRLYLPAKVPHTAQVLGGKSVTYLVGQRRTK